MRVLILADGDAPARGDLDRAWPGWDGDIALVIAADGGARHATALGFDIDLWVGDGDSLGEPGLAALAATGVAIERSPTDKDESDTELAVRAAIRQGASGVIILGAMGGPRIDHALANVTLLAMPDLETRSAIVYGARSRIRLLRGTERPGGAASMELRGTPGDLVSLLPLGDGADGLSTQGLAYALHDEPLRAGSTRGLSNVMTSPAATVSLRSGRLLVIESPATLQP